MHKISLSDIAMEESYHEGDDAARWLACFPFTPGAAGETETESESLTVVYNELEAGAFIGTHWDGTDEALLVLKGTVEARIDDETGIAVGGEIVLIPAETPHSVHNVGDRRAQMVGFFGDAGFESSFERPVHSATE